METLQCRCLIPGVAPLPLASPLSGSRRLAFQKLDAKGAKPRVFPAPQRCKHEDGGRDDRIRPVRWRCREDSPSDGETGYGGSRNLSDGVSRREAVLGALVAGLSISSLANSAQALPPGNSDVIDDEAVSTAFQVDEINAYSYAYSVMGGQRMVPIRWIESRKPERYSSAAPLAPDARQRIVSERLNIKNNLVVSVSIGPPNLTILKTTDPNKWNAKDVALSVLTDKSTSRKPTGQRVAESSVLNSKSEERDGTRYYYYEYLEQKSPTVTERKPEAVRHCIAVTAEREGFFYTLNASTSGQKWSVVEPIFRTSIQSFRLEPTTTEYVPPYKDPWRFW